mmetsp:Transcript_20882/g.47098  ORF Transcript_20882/g.47098 Transcript_20882/m.47098 type:complete len:709 (-) Transcript_20882:198-2324(-)
MSGNAGMSAAQIKKASALKRQQKAKLKGGAVEANEKDDTVNEVELEVQKAAVMMKKLGQEATSRSVGNLEAKAARNVTGVLGSNPLSRDLKILSFSLQVHGKRLVEDTTLELSYGQRYGLIGSNGCGKSTFLTCLAARELPLPEHVDIFHLDEEAETSDRTALQAVIDVVQAQVQRLEAMAEHLCETAGPDNELLLDIYDRIDRMDPNTFELRATEILMGLGFSQDFLKKKTQDLSGGWRMRVALGRALLSQPALLLLDEPTNHLDAASRNWLAEYLVTLTSTTVCIVSHDYEFLGKTCEDVLHIAQLQLAYYHGGFNAFAEARPDVMEALPTLTESGATAVINFPDPGRLDGVKSRSKPILELRDLTFYYPGQDKPTFTSVFGKFTVMSRVALLGPNGAGKTTLLRQIVGDMATDQGTGKHTGEIIKHHNLRIAYIAQHSMHHLEENMRRSPVQYVQDRFVTGLDKELSKRETMKLSPEEEALCSKNGNISKVIGRAVRGGELCYETERWGREREGSFWEPLGSVKCKDPYVLKLCLNFDAKLQAFQSGAEVRPCTEKEILKHLADFGISHRLAQSGRIKGMSGGQKCRLVLASAVWNKPHLIALDEPTNYLDNETLNALTGALQRFKGAILVITHHAQFSNDVTNEKWMVDHGSVTVTQTAKEARLARNNSQDSLARSDSQESMSQSESMNSLSAALSSQSLSKDE